MVLEVSNRSWHTRLLRWMHYPPPNNLCGYFWAVAFMVLMTPFRLVLQGVGFILQFVARYVVPRTAVRVVHAGWFETRSRGESLPTPDEDDMRAMALGLMVAWVLMAGMIASIVLVWLAGLKWGAVIGVTLGLGGVIFVVLVIVGASAYMGLGKPQLFRPKASDETNGRGFLVLAFIYIWGQIRAGKRKVCPRIVFID